MEEGRGQERGKRSAADADADQRSAKAAKRRIRSDTAQLKLGSQAGVAAVLLTERHHRRFRHGCCRCCRWMRAQCCCFELQSQRCCFWRATAVSEPDRGSLVKLQTGMALELNRASPWMSRKVQKALVGARKGEEGEGNAGATNS